MVKLNDYFPYPSISAHELQQGQAVSAYMRACKSLAAYVVQVPGMPRNEPLIRVIIKTHTASITAIIIVSQGGGVYSVNVSGTTFTMESRAVALCFQQVKAAMAMPKYGAGYFDPSVREAITVLMEGVKSLTFDTNGGTNWINSLEDRSREVQNDLAIHRVL